MLKPSALFLNGVYESVLEEILQVQAFLPEQIMFLQPYSGSAIKVLQNDPPSVEHPMRLFLSISSSLNTILYQAEIVGWENKRDLRNLSENEARKQVINHLIAASQPSEVDLYKASKTGDGESVNLIYIRRLQKLNDPFSTSLLRKVRGGEPLRPRTTSGGWSYVEPEPISAE